MPPNRYARATQTLGSHYEMAVPIRVIARIECLTAPGRNAKEANDVTVPPPSKSPLIS